MVIEEPKGDTRDRRHDVALKPVVEMLTVLVQPLVERVALVATTVGE